MRRCCPLVANVDCRESRRCSMTYRAWIRDPRREWTIPVSAHGIPCSQRKQFPGNRGTALRARCASRYESRTSARGAAPAIEKFSDKFPDAENSRLRRVRPRLHPPYMRESPRVPRAFSFHHPPERPPPQSAPAFIPPRLSSPRETRTSPSFRESPHIGAPWTRVCPTGKPATRRGDSCARIADPEREANVRVCNDTG
jgi:hypothetical protein